MCVCVCVCEGGGGVCGGGGGCYCGGQIEDPQTLFSVYCRVGVEL